MGKYRKKPIVIDAVPISHLFHKNLISEPWVIDAAVGNIIVPNHKDSCITIHTLEGVMRGEYDDYLIRGVKGELYPCKKDIFEATYEEVKDEGR